MDIDFTELLGGLSAQTRTDPRELFASLPNKVSNYNYLRDVQAEVLDAWFLRRTDQDLKLTMNTGGGKTLVGLLLLQSSLNEGIGPAVYIAPTPFLAEQVIDEGNKLGLAMETDVRALAVARGQAILVTNIHKLINGKSVFGVHPEPPKIDIGTIVVDDAHACLATVEQQFTATIPFAHPISKPFLAIISEALKAQSASRYLEVSNGQPGQLAMVPFWTWQSRISEIRSLLYAHRESDELKFWYPLMHDHLKFCRCIVGNNSIELSPPCIPISAIPSFIEAKRRLFMSATFSDDSILVNHFAANPETIANAIAPKAAADIGDRLIVVPRDLDPTITDEQIKQYASAQSAFYNVIVLVPSKFRARFWEDVAHAVVTSANLQSVASQLTKAHVGLVVLINQYDGVDLPHDACRLLILDGLPDVRRMIDRLDQSCLRGTHLGTTRAVQIIEQGMGRGIRANDDYCGIVLMGATLLGPLYRGNGLNRLSPATKAQFDMSEKIGSRFRNKSMTGVATILDFLLKRDAQYLAASKALLSQVRSATEISDTTVARARRSAFDLASAGSFAEAERALQNAKNSVPDSSVRGWIGWQLAELRGHSDPTDAQQILQSAYRQNRQVPIRPIEGISNSRLSAPAKSQAEAALSFLRSRFEASNRLLVEVSMVLDQLQFLPNSAAAFEAAFADLAQYLGFQGQETETESGAGPDVLWATGNLSYLVIECKNEATATLITKEYVNQLGGSVNWFRREYDTSCTCTPLLVHPSILFQRSASPPEGTRIMDAPRLASFRSAIQQYVLAAAPIYKTCTTEEFAAILNTSKLLADQMVGTFSVAPQISH